MFSWFICDSLWPFVLIWSKIHQRRRLRKSFPFGTYWSLHGIKADVYTFIHESWQVFFLCIQGCIRALGQTWHSEHFSCDNCGLNFAEAGIGYHENEGTAFCGNCYTNNILPQCKGCKKPITDRTMKAMDAQWHVSCFVCKVLLSQKSEYRIFFRGGVSEASGAQSHSSHVWCNS